MPLGSTNLYISHAALKKFNMTARVNLETHQIAPKAQLKVLGLWIDGKLRWGPHIKEIQTKMSTQSMALTKVATSTWGATLNKARQVYTAVVRPAMTHGASVWHLPKDSRKKGTGSVAKLVTLQNKCLSSITGAYKATNIEVLEAESGVIPLDIHLDQAVLRSREASRCSEIIKQAKAKIQRKLRGKRGRKHQPGATPMSIKDKWAKDSIDRLQKELETTQRAGRKVPSHETIISKWAKQKWEKRWNHYLDSIPIARKTPAHDCKLGPPRDKLHQGLRKAESSVAIQLRTEKVGFAAFLHARRVPDVVSPACQCGWRQQDPKHIIIFCPNHAHNRRSLYEAAGTSRYQELMSTGKGLRAVARWVINEGLLSQFALAKEQIDRAEGRAKEHDDDDSADDDSAGEEDPGQG